MKYVCSDDVSIPLFINVKIVLTVEMLLNQVQIRFCSIRLWFQSLNIAYEVFSQMVYKFIYFDLCFVQRFSKIKSCSKEDLCFPLLILLD